MFRYVSPNTLVTSALGMQSVFRYVFFSEYFADI